MAITCFECQEPGHIAADCPNREIDSRNGKPPWCGICDSRTRLVGLGPDGPLARCATCHPLRGQLPRHLKRCGGCRMVVHEWDSNPCGSHSSPVIAVDRRPPREEIDAIVGPAIPAINEAADGYRAIKRNGGRP